jgi:hypothetical protein
MKMQQAAMIFLWALGGAQVMGGEWSIDVANASRFEEPLKVVVNGEAVGAPLPPGTSSGLLGLGKGTIELVISAGEKEKWTWKLEAKDGQPLVVVVREKMPAEEEAEEVEVEVEKRELDLETFEFRKGKGGAALMVFSRLPDEKQFSLTVKGARTAVKAGVMAKVAAEPGTSASVRVGEELLDRIDVEEGGNNFFYVCEDEDDNLRTFHWFLEGEVVYLKN